MSASTPEGCVLRLPSAGVIADPRALELDHLGAEISQQIRGPRACEDVSEVQYPAPRREGPSGHHPAESATMPPHRRDAL
jgi:hypothetical protein